VHALIFSAIHISQLDEVTTNYSTQASLKLLAGNSEEGNYCADRNVITRQLAMNYEIVLITAHREQQSVEMCLVSITHH
jgi:hypothetical protein